MSPTFTEAERGEILLGLRELRQHSERQIRASERKLEQWTDEREASNPGYREFLRLAIEGRRARLVRIAEITRKVNRMQVES